MNDLIDLTPIKLGKMDVARRQLVTAIRIYFANGDCVSTHTLAAAAFEILDDLDNHGADTGTVFDHVEEYIKPEQIGTFQKLRRAPQNFFKHADKDPEETFEFYPTAAEATLWAAAMKYEELANESSLELAAVRTWIMIQNPDILIEPYRQQVEGSELSTNFTHDMRRQYFERFSTAYTRSAQQAFQT